MSNNIGNNNNVGNNIGNNIGNNNNNNNSVKLTNGEFLQSVDYINTDAQFNCNLSQPNSRYSFDVKSGYAAGMYANLTGYPKLNDLTQQVQGNPLDLINKK